jgi:predicted N-acetyltransferase YhbS
MIVRAERVDDFPEIRGLVMKAFSSAAHAEGDEQDFIERLRGPDTYIPELALVIEREARLIGHIILIRASISTKTARRPILLLACVAVVFEERNQGIGTMLIETGLQRARDLGHAAIVLVGDPAFYSRFGFEPSVRFGITNENGFEHEHVQVYELSPGALCDVSGTILLTT